MTDPVIGLNPNDVKTLQALIDEVRDIRHNSPLRTHEGGDHQAPEVYIARSTASINGLTVGAGNVTGSGSIPGSGTCDVYKLDTTNGILEATGASVIVYNLSTQPVTAIWFPIQRDKYGQWLAPVGAASATGGPITTQAVCNCFNCISPSQATVGTCTDAPDGAPTDFFVTIGIWADHPELFPNAQIHLTHGRVPDDCSAADESSSSSISDDGCTWYSCTYLIFAEGSSSSSSSSPDFGVYQFQSKIYIDALGDVAFKCIPVLLEGDEVIYPGFAETW